MFLCGCFCKTVLQKKCKYLLVFVVSKQFLLLNNMQIKNATITFQKQFNVFLNTIIITTITTRNFVQQHLFYKKKSSGIIIFICFYGGLNYF